MKTKKFHLLILFTSVLALFACSDKKTPETTNNDTQGQAAASSALETISLQSGQDRQTIAIDWDQIPTLNNIGDFPFIVFPDNLNVYEFADENNIKDGITDLYDFKKFEVYTGKDIVSLEGKLAAIFLMEDTSNGFKYDQYLFDRSVQDYLKKIGAKLLYQGNFPEDEKLREKLKENLFTGKYQTHGLADDAPFSVYAFKNNGKKYVLITQSNSVEGKVFVLELQDFEQNISAYKANDIQKELDNAGKALLYINFDTDKAVLKADGVAVVDEIAKVLQTTPKLNISIEGHTDNTGDAAHNKTLSLQRAQAVSKALVAKEISPDRLQAKGFGSEKPLVENNTEENKAKNRRVELVKS